MVVVGAAACRSTPLRSATGPTTTLTTVAFTAGSPWSGALTTTALPVPMHLVVATACPTTTRCWAVGSTTGTGGAPNGAGVMATTNGGRTWALQPIPATVAFLTGVACADTQRCVAVGQGQSDQAAAIATTDGGATWSPATVPGGDTLLTAVTCDPDRFCLAAGTSPMGELSLTSTTAGATWLPAGGLPSGTSGVGGISCVDDLHCWAAGWAAVDTDHVAGEVAATATGGMSWTTVALPSPTGDLYGVSCVTGATGTTTPSAPTTTTGPTTTAPAGTVPPGSSTTAPGATATTAVGQGGQPGVACVVVGTTATTLGVARSGHGVVLTSDDGGATWALPAVPATVAGLLGVSCPSADTCAAVGESVATVPAAGVALFTGPVDDPWHRSTSVALPQPLTSVACPTTERCVAAGESIGAYLAAS